MIAVQDGEFTPIPFEKMVDPETGTGRIRQVDVTTESYSVARDYMVRLEPHDFIDPAWVDKLAGAAGLSAADFRQHFAKLSGKQ